jgi:hypothetical protein
MRVSVHRPIAPGKVGGLESGSAERPLQLPTEVTFGILTGQPDMLTVFMPVFILLIYLPDLIERAFLRKL